MGKMIKLKNIRLVWPRLWEKRAFEGDPNAQATYNASFLISKTDPQLKVIHEAIIEMVKEKWPKNAKNAYNTLKLKDKLCLRDGNVHQAGKEEFRDHYYISAASSKEFPRVSKGRIELTKEKDPFYGGCRVLVFLEIWPQDSEKAKRINARIAGIQFMADDKPINTTLNPGLDEFEDFGEDTATDLNTEDLDSFLQTNEPGEPAQVNTHLTTVDESMVEDDLPF